MGYLTQEEKEKLQFDWRYKGASVIDLLTEAECDEINKELENLRIKRNSLDSNYGEYDPYHQPHKESDLVSKVYSHPKLIELAEFLIGTKIYGSQSWAYFKPPGQLGRDQHQNIFYTGVGFNQILNISIALDDHSPENGSVWYYEASHRLPVLPIEVDEERTKTNPTTWKNERGKPCVMPAGHNFIKVDGYLARGQCAIIHSHVVHGSEANTSNTFRRALLGGFVSVDTKLRSGEHMKREPIDLYSMNKKYWI